MHSAAAAAASAPQMPSPEIRLSTSPGATTGFHSKCHHGICVVLACRKPRTHARDSRRRNVPPALCKVAQWNESLTGAPGTIRHASAPHVALKTSREASGLCRRRGERSDSRKVQQSRQIILRTPNPRRLRCPPCFFCLSSESDRTLTLSPRCAWELQRFSQLWSRPC